MKPELLAFVLRSELSALADRIMLGVFLCTFKKKSKLISICKRGSVLEKQIHGSGGWVEAWHCQGWGTAMKWCPEKDVMQWPEHCSEGGIQECSVLPGFDEALKGKSSCEKWTGLVKHISVRLPLSQNGSEGKYTGDKKEIGTCWKNSLGVCELCWNQCRLHHLSRLFITCPRVTVLMCDLAWEHPAVSVT